MGKLDILLRHAETNLGRNLPTERRRCEGKRPGGKQCMNNPEVSVPEVEGARHLCRHHSGQGKDTTIVGWYLLVASVLNKYLT